MWRAIDTAPKDGTRIDLWVVDTETGDGKRVCDAFWGKYWLDVLSSETAIGWATEAEVYETTTVIGLEEEGGRVTHWMPSPDPPVA